MERKEVSIQPVVQLHLLAINEVQVRKKAPLAYLGKRRRARNKNAKDQTQSK
jgi:hypothetical protein